MNLPPRPRLRGWAVVGFYAVFLALALRNSGRVPAPPSARPTPRFSPKPALKPAGEGAIAVVELRGPISLGMGCGFRDGAADGVVRRLRELRDQPEVKAIVLRINSPGGTVAAVQEIHGAVLAAKKAGKKVVASLGDVAASGGYYVAVAADRVLANPGTLVGSIGVVFHLVNLEDVTKKIGVRFSVIKSGTMKDIGSPYRSVTEAEKKVFEGLVASAYGQFLTAVSRGRGLSRGKLFPLADGRVFTGEQALAVGLVDALGGYDEAISEAARLAGITSRRPWVIAAARPWERWMRAFGAALEGPWADWRRLIQLRGSLDYVWE